jgi:hypothetical protein
MLQAHMPEGAWRVPARRASCLEPVSNSHETRNSSPAIVNMHRLSDEHREPGREYFPAENVPDSPPWSQAGAGTLIVGHDAAGIPSRGGETIE